MLLGISLIPNIGNQTQKIPPITSVKESNVNSAAGIAFEPIEYKINPKQTSDPWTENKAWFLLVDSNMLSFDSKIIVDTKAQKAPAKATVVNFGVSFLHLKLTENIENPRADKIPKNNPNSDPFW